MATTFIVDNELAERFREAVKEKHGTCYGKTGKEVSAALESRIAYLKKTTVKKDNVSNS